MKGTLSPRAPFSEAAGAARAAFYYNALGPRDARHTTTIAIEGGCPVELPDIETLGNWAPGDYSNTSSAVSTRSCEIVRPKLLAVFRLMTSSNFVGCWTGNSAGLAPLRI
jgi:hypothetical protein